MKKNNFNYFTIFREMVEGSMAAARLLDEIMNDYVPDELEERMEAMHKIEHSNDSLVHHTLKELVTEFLPPIEREDITDLMESLDNSTDKIEDVLFALYMYNIHEIRQEALEFSALIVEAVDALYDAICLFPTFNKNYEQIRKFIIKVNDLEEKGDRLHMSAVRALYKEQESSKDVVVWTRTFDRLERCLDSIESIANQIESIIMNNS
ncbi:MAG: DUF47 family protein [Tissierellia bacterium]|nr:DUF47 family protein [Tissierellia bacterium]